MHYKRLTYLVACSLLSVVGSIILQACSKEEPLIQDKNSIAVPFAINNSQEELRSVLFDNNGSHTVNRILILPFRKTDENSANDDQNFVPDFTEAKQFNVNSFPAYGTMLDLTAGSSYKVMVIGYNQNDYDITNSMVAGTRFAINSLDNITLDNIQLSLTSPVSTPEFFVCTCDASLNNNVLDNIFVTQQGIKLSGSLERIVSGLSFEIVNVPDFVDSISLIAEQLVTAVKVKDATATVWQTAGDAGNKVLKTQIPVNDTISFTTYLLPTFDEHKTKLFLDVYYYGETERYEVNVNDVAGVSSSNSITFVPNQAVNITGDFADINVGFTINDGSINLDNNDWDGLE